MNRNAAVLPGSGVTRTAALGLFAILFSVLEAHGVGLEFEQVELAENAVVQFSEIYCTEIEEIDELLGQSSHWRCADTDSFRVCSDPETIEPSRYAGFSYVLYVRPRAESGLRGLCECRLSATPIGSFLDQEGEVDFTVTFDGITESGSLRLPLHSTLSEHFLSFQLEEIPIKVRIGKSQTLRIGLQNRLRELEIILGDEVDAQVGDPSVWENHQVRAYLAAVSGAGQSEHRIAAGVEPAQAVAVDVKSRRWEALTAAFPPFRAEKRSASENLSAGAARRQSGVHDKIIVYVPYQTKGGLPRILEIEIPVRFEPSPLLLVLAVVSGALLARVLSYFQKPVRLGLWLKRAVVGAVFAFLGWLIGLLLVEAGSELKLVGLVFDPYQLVPAFLIGVILGLSRPRLVRRLEELAGGGQGDRS